MDKRWVRRGARVTRTLTRSYTVRLLSPSFFSSSSQGCRDAGMQEWVKRRSERTAWTGWTGWRNEENKQNLCRLLRNSSHFANEYCSFSSTQGYKSMRNNCLGVSRCNDICWSLVSCLPLLLPPKQLAQVSNWVLGTHLSPARLARDTPVCREEYNVQLSQLYFLASVKNLHFN